MNYRNSLRLATVVALLFLARGGISEMKTAQASPKAQQPTQRERPPLPGPAWVTKPVSGAPVETREACLASIANTILALAGSDGLARGIPQWAHYRNERWGFCVDYPKGWAALEGIDRAGIFVHPVDQASGRERSGIEIGARVNQPSETNSERRQTLNEIFRPMPDAQPVYGKVGDVRVLDKRSGEFQGSPAIFSKIEYEQASEAWVAENITFLADGGDVVYLVEMRCRSTQYSAFHRIFSRMVWRTFKIKCIRAAGFLTPGLQIR